MNFKNQLKDILGDRHTGVKFNGTNNNSYRSPDKPIKFCEAIVASLRNHLYLKEEDIDCLGARRAFGFYHDDISFANEISKETKISFDFINNAIAKIPFMGFPLENILLGNLKNPDLTIAFVKPAQITKLILLYAKFYNKKPVVSPYFFMSVCANIAVQTHLSNRICISFGCPESRIEGRVQKDEAIVGIPRSLINN